MFANNLKCIVLVLCVNYFRSLFGSNESLRVFQGRDAVPGEFPYVVALAIKSGEGTPSEFYQFVCSGSIVTPVWTLTAGHCIHLLPYIPSETLSTNKPKLVIRYAITSEKKHLAWGSSEVTSTLLFPGYKVIAPTNGQLTVINDIGLLKTKKVTVSVLGRFSSVNYQTLIGHKVSTGGFGLMKSKNGPRDALSLNKSLQVYQAIITKCPRVRGTIRPSFCMSWECNKPAKSCRGDSGGPIIHPSGIVAVLTASDDGNCDLVQHTPFSGITTPISPFLDWIVSHIRTLIV